MKPLILYAIITLGFSSLVPAPRAAPEWPGYLADPQVWRAADGFYYCYGTGLFDTGQMETSLVPPNRGHFPVLRSRDLVNWEWLGPAMPGDVERVPGGPSLRRYWAPEVIGHGGRYLLYYAGDFRLRIAVADAPAGPFVDTGTVLLPDRGFAIDAHPFRDPVSGKWYLFFAKKFDFGTQRGTGLAVVQLGDDLRSTTGPVHPITTEFLPWHTFDPKVGDFCVEAPFVVFREGRYYCFYSAGNWKTASYGVGCAVADAITGPYTDKHSPERGAVIHTEGETQFGPGHCSVVRGPDGKMDFLIYHAWDNSRTRRVPWVAPLVWTADGPRAGHRRVPALPVRAAPRE